MTFWCLIGLITMVVCILLRMGTRDPWREAWDGVSRGGCLLYLMAIIGFVVAVVNLLRLAYRYMP